MNSVRSMAEALAEFAAGVRPADLPSAVRQVAAERLVDTVGVILAAVGHPVPTAVLRATAPKRYEGSATVLGEPRTTTEESAALANGVMAHCLELDDEHHEMLGHPGAVCVPACLAVAETTGASGPDFLAAVVVSYEVACRVGMAFGPNTLYARGFHPTGVCGTFGAAAGAGRLLGLRPPQLVHALGIAGSLTGSIMEFVQDGSLTKPLHPGWAARAGVAAARLAAEGLTGPRTVFEGESGVLRAFGEDQSGVAAAIEGLGRDYELLNVATKPYACCSFIHAAIDAAADIREEALPAPEDIEEVLVDLHSAAMWLVGRPVPRKLGPETVVDAQFSVYFGVAGTLVYGVDRANLDPLLELFQAERLRQRPIADMAAKVKVQIDPALDRFYPRSYPARVQVRLRGGRLLRAEARSHRGDPSIPGGRFSLEQLSRRFLRLTGPRIGAEAARGALAALVAIEEAGDIRDVTRRLQSGEHRI